MKCNVGGMDRTARIGIGTALIAAGLLAPMGRKQKTVAFLTGAYQLITGFSHY